MQCPFGQSKKNKNNKNENYIILQKEIVLVYMLHYILQNVKKKSILQKEIVLVYILHYILQNVTVNKYNM